MTVKQGHDKKCYNLSRSVFSKDFTVTLDIIVELYNLTLVNGKITTDEEPRPEHQKFIMQNKEQIIEVLKNKR